MRSLVEGAWQQRTSFVEAPPPSGLRPATSPCRGGTAPQSIRYSLSGDPLGNGSGVSQFGTQPCAIRS